MLSNSVQNILKEALTEVQNRRHEMLTVEHVLYAFSNSIPGRKLLEMNGVSVSILQQQLEGFFRQEVTSVDKAHNYEIIQSIEMHRLIDRAFTYARNFRRSKVETPDLFLSIIDEQETYSSYYLRKQGVQRQNILKYLAYEQEQANKNAAEKPEEEKNDKTDPLKEFTTELTQKAREGKIDPLIGRDMELDRAIEVLCRRRKNNPLFVGDPGVGKTAMAEGLALRIAEGNVPEMFLKMRIFALDMGSVLAGTKYRGDFESRLKSIIESIKKMPDSILFIDEIHTIVGAGATTGGSMDASNLLKPALANGDIRCIGSTTYEEFRNHFEKDRALARRFQKIDLKEPGRDDCIAILKGIENRYANHHGVKYPPAILEAIVELSTRHVRDRMQPDKAIDVLDECGAAVRLSIAAETRANDHVLMTDVERIVARMAGVPASTVTGSERMKLANLKKDLNGLVFGQENAIDTIVKAILRARAGLSGGKRPAGSFLFYGPTGVGKTEVAKSLAQIMGVEFLRYDMSEYMEKHSVSRLIGSPPGYVGFEQGGLLTEAVRKAPYSVVLLDEIEKAHPDIYNILLQVMDYASLTDNTGRSTDFSNVILIMTSNAGTFEMSKSAIGFSKANSTDAADKALKAVETLFTPEFRNRLDGLIPFNSLSEDMMFNIVDKFIKEICTNLRAKKVEMTVKKAARNWLAQKGYDKTMGARPLRRLIRCEVEDKLAYELLFGNLKKGGKIILSVNNDSLQIETKPLKPAKQKIKAFVN